MSKRTDKTAASKPPPHRYRFNVPQVDESVVMWMGMQNDPSISIRMLIRESIERLGYVDVFNRPVAQLPKRGRPSGAEEEPGALEVTAQDAALRGPAPAPAAEPDVNETDPEPVRPHEAAVSGPMAQHHDGAFLDEPSPEPLPGQQVDVNEMFAHLRQ
ncbi:hypothetical protein ANMWB30_09450 [Arthrobacter sp. MWB30]|nr:hypothetical protein ANMWB30_09450 [Arthrobacter sp. MWB30]